MTKIAIYLDVDTDDNDLQDSSDANITAGWYTYPWPLGEDHIAGPFQTEQEAMAVKD